MASARVEKNVEALVLYGLEEFGVEARAREFGLINIPQSLNQGKIRLGDWIRADISLQAAPKVPNRYPAWTVLRFQKIPAPFPNFSVVTGDSPDSKCVEVEDVPAMITSFDPKNSNGFAYSEHLGRISLVRAVTQGIRIRTYKVKDMVRLCVKEIWGRKRFEVRDFYWIASAIRPDSKGVTEEEFPSIKTCRTTNLSRIDPVGFGFFEVEELGGQVFFGMSDFVGFDGDMRQSRERIEWRRERRGMWEVMAVPTHYSRPTRYRAVSFRPLITQREADAAMDVQITAAEPYFSRFQLDGGSRADMERRTLIRQHPQVLSGDKEDAPLPESPQSLSAPSLAQDSGINGGNGSWISEREEEECVSLPDRGRLSLDEPDALTCQESNEKATQTDSSGMQTLAHSLITDYEIYDYIRDDHSDLLKQLMLLIS